MKTMKTLKNVLCTLALLALASCGDPLTQIVLRVNSDIPTSEVGPVLITVRGPSGEVGVEYTADFSSPGGPTEFPITLGLVLAEDAVGETVSVEVVADEVDEFDRVEVSARTNFVPGSSRELALLLDTACIEIPCDTGETCRGGVCVTNLIEGESLPEFSE